MDANLLIESMTMAPHDPTMAREHDRGTLARGPPSRVGRKRAGMVKWLTPWWGGRKDLLWCVLKEEALGGRSHLRRVVQGTVWHRTNCLQVRKMLYLPVIPFSCYSLFPTPSFSIFSMPHAPAYTRVYCGCIVVCCERLRPAENVLVPQ